MQDVGLGRAGVLKFHQQLDAAQYDEIYASAAPELRNASSRDDLLALLSAVHRKFGNVQDPAQTQFNVNWTTSGTRVVLVYHTKFALADADETFTWQIADGKAFLLGYHINSLALVTK